ncbi:MAG TPA: hypothetical protein PKV94_10885, partial [Syntrophales bacterium]|nr:hypothetical protein [Syntrophales bacterium]
ENGYEEGCTRGARTFKRGACIRPPLNFGVPGLMRTSYFSGPSIFSCAKLEDLILVAAYL